MDLKEMKVREYDSTKINQYINEIYMKAYEWVVNSQDELICLGMGPQGYQYVKFGKHLTQIVNIRNGSVGTCTIKGKDYIVCANGNTYVF